MLLLEPQRTQFDLNFRLFGFPIRVHPFFWLFAIIFGLSDNGAYTVIWVGVLFFSILIHELGHAFVIRRLGRTAHIVLYAMGGLAIEGRSDPYGYEDYSAPRSRTPQEQIMISIAGPAAQFVLAAIVVALVYAAGGEVVTLWEKKLVPMIVPVLPEGSDNNLRLLVMAMIYVNTFWPLLNLLPVIPLDGGQISQALFTVQDPWQGVVKALWLSMWTGGIMAVLGLLVFQEMFIVLLFASLGYSSYMTLQQMTGGGGRGW